MSILNWFVPKRIAVEAKVVRWRQPNSTFGSDCTEHCFLLEDKEGELHSIICDLESSPEANLADVGDLVSFLKFPNGHYAYKLKIVTAAGTQAK